MQPLTGAPRDGFTTAQITALLQCPAPVVDGGLELLDQNDTTLLDLRDTGDYVLTGSSVSRDCTADVQGTCQVTVTRALNWGADRVRPYLTITGPDDTGTIITARWNLGVFVLTTPQRVVGQSIETYTVTGYDKNYLLQNLIGDSRTYTAGTNVLTAVTGLITDSGTYGAVLFDGTSAGVTLQADMVFPFSADEQDSYLTVINQLLAAISYRPLWVDQDGNFRSGPATDPADMAVEFAFTADDELLSLIGVQRTLTNDLWSAPNEWIFVNTSMPDVSDGDGGTVPATPVEGDGQYTFDNVNNGPSSQAALGRVVRKAYFIEAADQASLEAAAAIQIALDQQVIWSVDTTTGLWPGAGHLDVYTLQDSLLGGLFKVQAQKWQMPLDGGDVSWTWQGAN